MFEDGGGLERGGGAGQFEQDDMGVVRCSVGIRSHKEEKGEEEEEEEVRRWEPIGCGPSGRRRGERRRKREREREREAPAPPTPPTLPTLPPLPPPFPIFLGLLHLVATSGLFPPRFLSSCSFSFSCDSPL